MSAPELTPDEAAEVARFGFDRPEDAPEPVPVSVRDLFHGEHRALVDGDES